MQSLQKYFPEHLELDKHYREVHTSVTYQCPRNRCENLFQEIQVQQARQGSRFMISPSVVTFLEEYRSYQAQEEVVLAE